MYDKHIAWRGGLDIERPGFGIAAEHAYHAFFIGAASIDRGGVNGVAGRNGENRFVCSRELAIEDGGNEIVALGSRAGWALLSEFGGEWKREGMFWIRRIVEGDSSGDCVALQRASGVFGAALIILGKEFYGTVTE